MITRIVRRNLLTLSAEGADGAHNGSSGGKRGHKPGGNGKDALGNGKDAFDGRDEPLLNEVLLMGIRTEIHFINVGGWMCWGQRGVITHVYIIIIRELRAKHCAPNPSLKGWRERFGKP
jgi:hypothetical protein